MTAISQRKLFGLSLGVSLVIFLLLRVSFGETFRFSNLFLNAAMITMILLLIFLFLEDLLKPYAHVSVIHASIQQLILAHTTNSKAVRQIEKVFQKKRKKLAALLKRKEKQLAKRHSLLEEQKASLTGHEQLMEYWEKITPDDLSAVEVLSMSSPEERDALRKIVGATDTYPSSLISDLRNAGTHGVTLMLSTPKTYREIVMDAAKQVGVTNRYKSTATMERDIIITTFQKALDNMSPEERNKVLRKLLDGFPGGHGQDYKGISSTAAAVLLAQSSGFGIYLLSSTLVGALTSAVGVTLPFAFYTSMSSTISVMIGPVGWAALAVWGVYKIGSANYKKTIPGIIMIGHLRAQIATKKAAETTQAKTAIDDLQISISKLQEAQEESNTRIQSVKSKQQKVFDQHQIDLEIALNKARYSREQVEQAEKKFNDSATPLEKFIYSLLRLRLL